MNNALCEAISCVLLCSSSSCEMCRRSVNHQLHCMRPPGQLTQVYWPLAFRLIAFVSDTRLGASSVVSIILL